MKGNEITFNELCSSDYSGINRKGLIYGFNDITKAACSYLINHNIYIEGFIISVNESKEHMLDITYLNKKMILLDNLKELESSEYVIFLIAEGQDTFDFLHTISNIIICSLFTLPSIGQDVIIYNARYSGEIAYRFFSEKNFNVKFFCDTNPEIWGEYKNGIRVISPNELVNRYSDYLVVLAFKNLDTANVVSGELGKQGVNNVYKMSHMLNQDIVLRTGYTLSPAVIYYYIKQIVKNRRRLVLWGNIEDVFAAETKFRLMDIVPAYGIDEHGYIGLREDILFKSKYELLRDSLDVEVRVFDYCRESVKTFISKTGIDANLFTTSCVWIEKFGREICLDPSLGYNVRMGNEESLIKVGHEGIVNQSTKKIIILGSSASDITFGGGRGWPDYLSDLIKENRMNSIIYDGAVSGYTVSQELVKLVRDGIPLKPNLVISYSGINEYSSNNPQHFFVNVYHADLIRKISENPQMKTLGGIVENKPCFGTKTEDYAEHWLNQQKMMHSICLSFGIKFYCIIEPSLYEKKYKTIEEVECLENTAVSKYNTAAVDNVIQKIREKVFAKKADYPWIVDFGNVFGDCRQSVYKEYPCHLNTYGNKFIAKKIFDYIKEEL